MIPTGAAISDAVSDLLRVHAEETFVTQTEIARRTGISQSAVSNVFNRRSRMNIEYLVEISRALGLSPVAVLAEAERITLDK